MTGEPESGILAEADPLAAGDAGGRVIRGSGLRVAAHVVGVGGGIISAPLVVRHLGVDDYGRFATVTAAVTVATALTEGGLANVAIRRMATLDAPGRLRLTANLLGLRLILGLLGALAAIAFGVLSGEEDVVVGGLALGGVALFLNGLWGVGTTVLVARLRLGSVATVDLVRAASTTLGLIALVVAGASLGAFYVLAPVVALLTLVAAVALAGREMPRLPRLDRADVADLLRETAVYAAATALGAVYFQVALLSTAVLSDDRETGVFGIAFRIVELVNGVPWLLAASAFPIFARAAAGETERLRYATARVAEAGVALGGLVAVGLAIGAGVAVEIVGGDEARDAEPVLRLLAPAALASYLVAAWSFVLLSLRRYRDLVLVNGGALLLAVVLSAVLVPSMGADGAATVTICLEAGLAIAYAIVLRARRPDVGPHIGTARAVVLALAAGLGTGAALLTIDDVLATAAALTAYAGVLLAARGVPQELFDALPRRRGA